MTNEIKNIWEWIFYIDSNVKFNMQMQWTLIATAIAFLGVALGIMAKRWFESRVDKHFAKMKSEIIGETTQYRVTTVLRDISLQGIQKVSHSNKIHALMIRCYFVDGVTTQNIRIPKDFLMYSENGVSHDSIKIFCANGADVEVKVKRLTDNGFELEWITNGDVESRTAGLDIMFL